MVVIIPLKKFKKNRVGFLKLIRYISHALFLFLLSFPSFAEDLALVPMIEQLGLIPLHSHGKSDLDKLDRKELLVRIEKVFRDSVKESDRFNLLQREIVNDLWDSPEERELLRKEYEIDGYLGLSVGFDQDIIELTVRLLDYKLDLLLQESERIYLDKLLDTNQEEFSNKIKYVVYRLINLIPADLYVTSVQQQYVTLSGGTAQNVNIGDRLEIRRVWIASRHPALGTWRTFEDKLVGYALVVEAKEQSSIAEVTELIRKDDLAIGDSIKSEDIKSRNLFQQLEKIYVTPEMNAKKIVVSKSISGQEEVPLPNSPSQAKDKKIENTEDKSGVVVNPENEEFGTKVDRFIGEIPQKLGDYQKVLGKYIDRFIDDISVKVGYRGFSYSGVGATGSRMNWYGLINHVGATITREFAPRLRYQAGGGLDLGKTQGNKGSFIGLTGHARIYWQDRLPIDNPYINTYLLGIHGAVNTFGVYREVFGGHDVLRGGAFAGVRGFAPIIPDMKPVDWYFDFAITPLTMGRVGYAQKQHRIRSSLGWKFDVGAFVDTFKFMEWGAGISYGTLHMFDDASNASSFDHFALYLQARWKY